MAAARRARARARPPTRRPLHSQWARCRGHCSLCRAAHRSLRLRAALLNGAKRWSSQSRRTARAACGPCRMGCASSTGGAQGHVDSKRGAPACDPKRSAAEIASLGQQCTDVWHAHRGSPLDSPLTMAPTDELLAYFYPKLSRGPKNVVRWDLGVEESQKLTS